MPVLFPLDALISEFEPPKTQYMTEFEQCLHDCVPLTFTPLSAASSTAQWKLNRGDLVLRTCPDCVATHRVIVYKRLSAAGSIDFRSLFLDTWRDSMPGGDNKMNTDFALYSSLEDAQVHVPSRRAENLLPSIMFPRVATRVPAGEQKPLEIL